MLKQLWRPIYMGYCKLIEIAVSRKFLVLWICTWLVKEEFLTGTEFIPVALAVLGVQAFLDNKTPPRVFHEEPSENN